MLSDRYIQRQRKKNQHIYDKKTTFLSYKIIKYNCLYTFQVYIHFRYSVIFKQNGDFLRIYEIKKKKELNFCTSQPYNYIYLISLCMSTAWARLTARIVPTQAQILTLSLQTFLISIQVDVFITFKFLASYNY